MSTPIPSPSSFHDKQRNLRLTEKLEELCDQMGFKHFLVVFAEPLGPGESTFYGGTSNQISEGLLNETEAFADALRKDYYPEL